MNLFLVRTPALALLVDAGVGCEPTIASDVFLQVVGTLPSLLARHGVAPDDVNHVVFTHPHEDHIGWADDPDSGEPTFANATYHVHSREWARNHTGETPDWVVQALDPVQRHGRLGLSELGRLTDAIEMVPLPGHTPGHVGIVITGPDARVVLVGDAINHPTPGDRSRTPRRSPTSTVTGRRRPDTKSLPGPLGRMAALRKRAPSRRLVDRGLRGRPSSAGGLGADLQLQTLPTTRRRSWRRCERWWSRRRRRLRP